MEKTSKTYKRETAWVFGVFVLTLFLWGLMTYREDIVDVAKFLTPFATTTVTAALYADYVRKQT